MTKLFQTSLYLLLLMFFQAAVQGENSQSLVENIISAYNGFDYVETDRLLGIALNQIDTFSSRDQIQIYQYAAFRKFRQNESIQVKENFWKLLEIDPSFTLDPLTTPPKILVLFQKTKIEFLESLQQRLQRLEMNISYTPTPWRSLVFPGWEQWHRGFRLKGALWMVAGAGLVAGISQAVIRTKQEKQDYENANSPEDIRTKYDDYNRLYQSQFYWTYGFLAVWLSSHFDVLFFTPAKSTGRISLTMNPGYPGLAFNLYF